MLWPEANKMAALDEYAARCKLKLPPGQVFSHDFFPFMSQSLRQRDSGTLMAQF